jgi:hypothetical protein
MTGQDHARRRLAQVGRRGQARALVDVPARYLEVARDVADDQQATWRLFAIRTHGLSLSRRGMMGSDEDQL